MTFDEQINCKITTTQFVTEASSTNGRVKRYDADRNTVEKMTCDTTQITIMILIYEYLN